MFEQELNQISNQIISAFEESGIPVPGEIQWVPIPFSGRWGMGTPVCYQAAALKAKISSGINVTEIASEIAAATVELIKAKEEFIELRAENAYINAYFDPAVFAVRVVDTALARGENFGRGESREDVVMVEYAQPNTHHSFHIGHYRNVILGESLSRLLSLQGYRTIRASYPGDIGLGVITCVWGYQKFYEGQEPEGIHARGQWLAKVYTESNQLLLPKPEETSEQRSQREEYDQERRDLYRRWDEGDPEVRALWMMTRQWSLNELEDILDTLDVKIDVYFFESEQEEPAKTIVEELINLDIAEDERPEGPVVVHIDDLLGLKKEKYRTAVILRSDGTTLYLTKDLALAKEKFEKYQVDRSLYVVDVRQSLHFQQVFSILQLWGFPQASMCYHLTYGFVSLPEGAMSSRSGNVILFKDVEAEALRRVQEIISEKNPSLSDSERSTVSQQVGLGALAYSMLSVDNNKDIVFRWEEALNFDGQSAPYIQNAYVRANSILKKAGWFPESADFSYSLMGAEIELIDLISRFPATVAQAASDYKPIQMANYAYELAKAFHGFYQIAPVLKAKTEEIRNARLRLVAATKQVLANALSILVIEAPEVM